MDTADLARLRRNVNRLWVSYRELAGDPRPAAQSLRRTVLAQLQALQRELAALGQPDPRQWPRLQQVSRTVATRGDMQPAERRN